MNQTRFLQLGWVLFAGVTALALAGGFQGTTEKIGVVNVAKVIDDSELGKQTETSLRKMSTGREELLRFVDDYRVLTAENAQKLRELWLKDPITKAEEAERDRIKADVVAANKRFNELTLKTSLTPEERTLMEEYARRGQRMNDDAQRWYREFQQELNNYMDQQKLTSLEKARTAIRQVAKEQGYGVVLDASIAPYGANDVSDAALKAMNTLK